jgi:septum formation protein
MSQVEAAPRLVLASTSRYRRELLARLDVPFEAAAPTFDEATLEHRFHALDDPAFALELARGKADSLADAHPDHYILAADQIAVVRDPTRRLLHKPGTVARAVTQLMELSGRSHVLTTGVVLACPATGARWTTVDQQRMTMRAFDEAEARRYVEAHRPLDCAGSYRIEDAGIALFESVEGTDYTGIIGLPLIAVSKLLREAGVLGPSGPAS